MYGKGRRDRGNSLADCFINLSGQRQTGVDAGLDTYIPKDSSGNHTISMNPNYPILLIFLIFFII